MQFLQGGPRLGRKSAPPEGIGSEDSGVRLKNS